MQGIKSAGDYEPGRTADHGRTARTTTADVRVGSQKISINPARYANRAEVSESRLTGGGDGSDSTRASSQRLINISESNYLCIVVVVVVLRCLLVSSVVSKASAISFCNNSNKWPRSNESVPPISRFLARAEPTRVDPWLDIDFICWTNRFKPPARFEYDDGHEYRPQRATADWLARWSGLDLICLCIRRLPAVNTCQRTTTVNLRTYESALLPRMLTSRPPLQVSEGSGCCCC